jgi:uncharacterized protein YggE
VKNRLTALAVVCGALIIAGAIALRPTTGSGPSDAFAASRVANEPGALAQFLRFSGTATVTVKPDTAEISVSTSGEGTSSKAALDQASDAMHAVIARLKSLGVASDDMQSGGVWTYREYDGGRLYHSSNSLRVVVRHVDQAGKLLAEANAAGADEVSGPSFSVADQRSAYRQALRQAIQDARAKADAAADQMRVKVSGVVSVADDSQAQSPQPYLMASAARDSTAKAVPVEEGTLEVPASVVVVFAYAS